MSYEDYQWDCFMGNNESNSSTSHEIDCNVLYKDFHELKRNYNLFKEEFKKLSEKVNHLERAC